MLAGFIDKMPMQNEQAKNAAPIPNDSITRFIYSLLILLLLPLVTLSLFIKSKKRSPAYFQRKRERFGILPKPQKLGGFLFHCVSVGEVVAATPVIKHILQTSPQSAVTVTTMTPTGSDQVIKTFGDHVNHCYLPYDFPLFVNQLLATYQPETVVITEVELWPNLIHQSKRRSISTFIMNARLTEKSAKSYEKLSWLFKPMLLKIDGICAQSKRDYDNYKKLCPELRNVFTTGNLKFDQHLLPKDLEVRDRLKTELFNEQRSIIIGASTHEPEERALLDVAVNLWKTHPKTLLLLVPRHPQRFEKVQQICLENRLKVQMLSENETIRSETQVLIADKMGILKSLYGLADIAFVGGSLADKGGHNALEAALYGIPVVMGPHIYNNPGICEVLEGSGGLVIAQDVKGITTIFQSWLDSPQEAKQLGLAGQAVITENGGALQRQLSIILNNK